MLSKEGLLGQLYKFQFVDYDVNDDDKFPELVYSAYMDRNINPNPNEPIILELHPWENRLMKSGILNLIEIPHFGRTP